MASVKIKARVASSSIASSAAILSLDLILYEVGDEKFKMYVPIEHSGQVIQHLIVLLFTLAFYVCVAESGVIYNF